MYTPFFSYEEARKTSMVEYLEKLGYMPQKIRGNDYWYLSPFRQEKESSFKVNSKLNAWYDHGMGRGGNIVDFGMLYHKCSYKELVEKLQDNLLFHPPISTVQQHLSISQNHLNNALEPKIKVIAAKPLAHSALCRYLDERKIPLEIARKYCQEVHYETNEKAFYSIGFKNNSGGYELRNANFKGSTSPKDFTLIEGDHDKDVTVFEGFFNFLSFQAINQNSPALTNFLVLNSLSFFEKSRPVMEKYPAINLYLDRDLAGRTVTEKAIAWNKKYTDQSIKYKNHKDLNNFLIGHNPEQKQVVKMRRHL